MENEEETPNIVIDVHNTYPIRTLRDKTIQLMSALLNPTKYIRSTIKTGNNTRELSRYWIGLAELCSLEPQLMNGLKANPDPTKGLIMLWQESRRNNTIGHLICYLEKLDRFDVINDISPLIVQDITFYIKNPNGYKTARLNINDEKYVLTKDDFVNIDAGLELLKYDAYVLFSDDDIEFATEVIETMEKQYNMKFCVKDRDLVAGTFEHEAIIKLISERCERLLVIISPSFIESTANKFFYLFAQSISIEQKQRKIIPCVYKKCPYIPPELKGFYMLDYSRTGTHWNFWDRLHQSIRVQTSQSSRMRVNNDTILRHRSMHTNTTRKSSNAETDSTEIASLKPITHSVKFNSLINLNSSETDKILSDQNLNPSTSANSLGVYPEKKHRGFLKKFLFKSHDKACHIKSNGDCDQVRPKKRSWIWNGNRKRRVEVPTT